MRLTPEDFARAQKYCKYAGSALQYEDVSTAVQNLQKALKLLTTGREWSLCPTDSSLLPKELTVYYSTFRLLGDHSFMKALNPIAHDNEISVLVSDSHCSSNWQPQTVFIFHTVELETSEGSWLIC